MQHPEGLSAVRLTDMRGEKETSKESQKCIGSGNREGGQFIQILNVRPLADGKRMSSSWFRGLAWQVLRDLFYVLMKRLRNSILLGHALLPSSG